MPVQQDRPRLHGRGAELLLAVGALAFTAVLFGLTEGALRLTGIGAPDASHSSRLKYQQIYLPILQPGLLADGTEILHTVDHRLPYQWIHRQKPADGLRVFTLGGSATAGLGFSPNVTFAHNLEQMLHLAHPDRSIEVMNLGIVALSSRQVKYLVAEVCRDYDPDLLIVYSGNNEFLEVHALKYAESEQTWHTPLSDALMETNLFRIVDRLLRGPPRAPSPAEQQTSHEDLRLTQDEIIQRVELTEEELQDVIDAYEKNFEEMAQSASEFDRSILLVTVASNWKWRGRSDLPDSWIRDLVDNEEFDDGELLLRARSAIDEELGRESRNERHDWLFRRAIVAEKLGDYTQARRDYREAMNVDPHLRRALDVMNQRLKRVAQRHGIPSVDLVESLSQRAEHGIVGFDEFYDYVHFTPRGALLAAHSVYDAILRNEILPDTGVLDLETHTQQELRRLAGLREDPFAVDQWLGFGFDPAAIADRDLWKYDRLLSELDRRTEARPADLQALVFRGNAQSFRIGGAAAAERDYRAALAVSDDAVIRENLERLLSNRRL